MIFIYKYSNKFIFLDGNSLKSNIIEKELYLLTIQHF